MKVNHYMISIDEFKTAVEIESKQAHEQSQLARMLAYSHALSAMLEKESRNPVKLFRAELQKEQHLLMELPLANSEIDALCLHGDGMQYTLLNSAQPKLHTNYGLCLAYFYYALYSNTENFAAIKPVYSSHWYNRPENLRAASAANLTLLPENSLREMFYHFYAEQRKEDGLLTILAKLVNYFEVPYFPLLIRCQALGLLNSADNLKQLLSVSLPQLQEEFRRLWLDESLLLPTMQDDFARLEQLVKTSGEAYVESEYLKPRTVHQVLSNMKNLYAQIREV